MLATSARLPTEPNRELRIVSLIASATEIVYELGLRPFLVGRSHECDFPPDVESLPCCTSPRFDCSGSSREIDRLVKDSVANALSVYDVSDELLQALQPTHIVTQTQCEVCAVSLRDVERSIASRLASQPQIIALQPNSLADIWEDMRRVAIAVDVDPEPSIARLQARILELHRLASTDARKPRVACIEWLEPLMAAGNWVPELVALANGTNLFGQAGLHSPWMTWREVVSADPEVIIAMPCGFDIGRTFPEMHWITTMPGYEQLNAVRNREVYVADGNQYFNRPGPRVVDSLQILVEILHPGVTGHEFEGSGYIRFSSIGSRSH